MYQNEIDFSLGFVSLFAVKRSDSMVGEVAKASGMISMMDPLTSSSLFLCLIDDGSG